MDASYTRVFSIAPNQRGCVGGLIGKAGIKIKETKSSTGAEIRFDKARSEFVVKGRVGACDKAIKSLSTQLADLMTREIERQQKRRDRPRYFHRAPQDTPPVSKYQKPKAKPNGFAGLVSDDGRTFEQVETDAAASAAAAAAARRAAKVQKRQEIQQNQNQIGLVGLNWADMDSDDDEDEEEMPTQTRYNSGDEVTYEDWVSTQKTNTTTQVQPCSSNVGEFQIAGQIYVKAKDHDQKPYAW